MVRSSQFFMKSYMALIIAFLYIPDSCAGGAVFQCITFQGRVGRIHAGMVSDAYFITATCWQRWKTH